MLIKQNIVITPKQTIKINNIYTNNNPIKEPTTTRPLYTISTLIAKTIITTPISFNNNFIIIKITKYITYMNIMNLKH